MPDRRVVGSLERRVEGGADGDLGNPDDSEPRTAKGPGIPAVSASEDSGVLRSRWFGVARGQRPRNPGGFASEDAKVPQSRWFFLASCISQRFHTPSTCDFNEGPAIPVLSAAETTGIAGPSSPRG